MIRNILEFSAGLLFLITGTLAFSDPGLVIKNAIFLPKEYYVGDRVELRIILEPEPGITISLPEKYPESFWLTYHDLTIKKKEIGIELRIIFTSYAPGTRSLPAINLGDAVLDSVKIHTASLLETDTAVFYGIKKPLLIPGTKLLLGILIGFLFIGPVFILGFAGSLRKKFHIAMALRKGRKPRKHMYRVLKELDEQKERMSSRQFYFQLSDEYRRYLWLRTGIDFITTTSTDFGRNLEKIIGSDSFVKQVAAMIMFSDSIKFGGVTVGSKRKEHDLNIVKESVELIEKSIEDKVRRKDSK